MSAVNVSNSNTKISYADATRAVATEYPGPVAALKKYGAAFTPNPGLVGGNAYQFNLLSTTGASTGGPTAAGSILYLGTNNPLNYNVAMTTSFIWAASHQEYERKLLSEVSGNHGQFFDEAAVKAAGLIKGFYQDMNLQMALTGNGDWTTLVTASPATIAAGATATITVARREFVRADHIYQVYTTNNTSLVADVVLYVNYKSAGPGQGTINVTNIGSGTYTLTAGDTFTMAYERSGSRLFFSGLLDAINNTGNPYPRVEGNNQQPAANYDYSPAVVAGSGQISLEKVFALIRQTQAQKSNALQTVDGLKDPDTGYIDSSSMVFIHPDHACAIRQQLATQQRFISGIPDTDSVWGPVTMIAGVPFYVQYTNPTDSALFVDAKGWTFEIPNASLRSTQNGAPWIAVPGTTLDEMAACTAVVSVCLDRKSQGILTGVSGISPATMATSS